MSLPLPLLQTVEALLNKGLCRNPTQQLMLAELQDKVFAFHLLGLETTVYVLPHVQGVYLLNQYEGSVDVTVTALPLTLLRFMTTDDSVEVEIVGDKEILEDLLLLTQGLVIDWEQLLTEKTDPVIANAIVSQWQKIHYWQNQQQQKLEKSCGDWLHNSQCLPTPSEYQQFNQDLQQLSEDVDGIATRVKALEMKF